MSFEENRRFILVEKRACRQQDIGHRIILLEKRAYTQQEIDNLEM